MVITPSVRAHERRPGRPEVVRPYRPQAVRLERMDRFVLIDARRDLVQPSEPQHGRQEDHRNERAMDEVS